MDNDLKQLLDAPYSFRVRPKAVDATDRLSWRLYIALLIVGRGTARGGCSLQRLQLLNWAALAPKHHEALNNAQERTAAVDRLDVRFDPALDRTLTFALASNLLEYDQNGKFRLTDDGQTALEEIPEHDSAFEQPIKLMESVGRKLTEARISALLTWGLK